MKYLITILLFCSLFAHGQNADWIELQKKIDDARFSQTGIVLIERNYIIDKPLVIAHYDSARGDYAFVNITLQGYATMWDNQNRSRIRATFNDAPILSIHKGKGVIIKGVNFQGPGWGRESRFSPQAAIAIDPFRYNIPPDGGYPTLPEWYRGRQSVSGSTGIRIEDCTFNGTICGVITSPNGYTLNAELITIENCRSYTVKYVIVGCQAQEKMNRVINLGAWGSSESIFQFNTFGQGHPGNWIVDGLNVAGNVKRLIYRASAGWNPMYMRNVFAENIETIGYWQTKLNDGISDASINFRFPRHLGYYPDVHLEGQGVTISNSNIRYYGGNIPLIFKGHTLNSVSGNDGGYINAKNDLSQSQVLQLSRIADIKITNKTAIINGSGVSVGQVLIFMNSGNWEFIGMGEVDSVGIGNYRVKYLSNSIIDGGSYRIGVKL